MVLNDVMEFASVVYNANQNAINVSHWKVTNVGGTGLSLQQAADGLSTLWAAQMKPCVPNGGTYKGAKARVVFPTPTAVLISTNGAGAGTLGAGDQLPPQVASVITLRASTAPPRTRGRLYMPAPTEAENSGTGVPTAAYITACAGIRTIMQVAQVITVGANSLTLTPVLYHRKPPQATYAIDSVVSRSFWGTQRRRSGINRNDVPAI